MSRLTFPLGAAGFSAGGALDLADAALPLAFSAGLALDFSGRADGAAGSGLGSAPAGAPSGRASLYWGFFSKREACLPPSNLLPAPLRLFSPLAPHQTK